MSDFRIDPSATSTHLDYGENPDTSSRQQDGQSKEQEKDQKPYLEHNSHKPESETRLKFRKARKKRIEKRKENWQSGKPVKTRTIRHRRSPSWYPPTFETRVTLCFDCRHRISGILKMTTRHFDVLVVGGGMVGATVATALGQQGVRVAVFDRLKAEPLDLNTTPELRVSALSYASEQILRQLGAWSYMSGMRMCPYRRMEVWEKLHHPWGKEVNSRPNQTVFAAADINYPQLGFIVENKVTQLGLLEAMKACDTVELFCPAHIEHIRFSDDRPVVTLADGCQFSGDLLVGADGAQSRVRQEAGLGIEQKDYEQQCLVATVEIEGGCQDITWQAFTATGPEAFLPLPDIDGRHYASIVWYSIPENIQRLKNISDEAFIEELSNTFPAELPPIKTLLERGSFPLARRHALRYWREGAVLVGDAAHTINPLAGQGVNLGFQDAAWLAEILVAAYKAGESLGSAEVLMQYEHCRKAENQKMMNIMDGFYHTFSNSNRPLKLIRNIGLSIAGQATPAIKVVMKYAMGMSGRQPRLARGESL